MTAVSSSAKSDLMDDESSMILKVESVSKNFGGVKAVDNCSFEIPKSSISALIGPNGAGKSTVVNLVSGALRPDSGRVLFKGDDITKVPQHRIAHLGLIRTFQISREFGAMTVLENLMVSPREQSGERLFTAIFRPSVTKREDNELVQKALDTLDVFGLYDMRNEYASSLSGGQKRLLELARAVMAEPEFLLLDEPMAGVTPVLIQRLGEHIQRMNQEHNITFLMVEHNLEIVERICEFVVVMAVGTTLATGEMKELRKNDAVIDAYLGG